jgi:glutamine---fructose-6-phosphate transaminase (isomerizing)
VPRTLEYLSPFLTIVPLYYMAYFLAVGRGNNPDCLRYLEPRYWGARGVIFPPGSH